MESRQLEHLMEILFAAKCDVFREDVYQIDHIENKNFFLPVKFPPY